MKYRIQRYKTTLTIADGGTTITSSAIPFSGILKGVLLDIPSLTSSATTTVEILDADGFTIYSKASIAHNAKSGNLTDAAGNPLHLPLSGNHTVKLTVSGAQTGAKNIPVVLLVLR